MGAVIFLVAVVIEMILALICISTKSNQKILKSATRIGAFLVFILLTLLTVFDWGARYYALAALLLLLGVNGLITLLRRKKEEKAFKPLPTVLKTIGIAALFFVATLPAIVFPQHAPIKATGTYLVATAAFTYTDETRIETYSDKNENRKLNVAFWYPEDYDNTTLNSCPLVVFSHGSLGIKTSNESLYNELASHGYVVCSIDHTYQCFYTTDADGRTAFINMDYMQDLKAENAKIDKQKSYDFYKEWMEIRTGDINFVVDAILAQTKNESADPLYTLIDSGKIGIMGHSLGGSAALGIGRLRDDVGAVIALEAPFMFDIEGVENGEFIWNEKPYPIPVLNVYSDGMWGRFDEWPQYAENAALLTDTDAIAFNAYMKGAGHLNLTDLALTSPILTRVLNGGVSAADNRDCLEKINRICLEFFDCYLMGKNTFTSEGTY